MLKQYQLKMPRAVYGGAGALENMRTILNAGVRKAAVFSDPGIAGAGLLKKPLSLLGDMGIETAVFDDLPAEPTCDQAQMTVDRFKKAGADFIIAIGGGSVMDMAKLASVSPAGNYGVRDLLEHPERAKKFVKTLMIPTTGGTGSEATPNSIVAVPERELKVGIVHKDMIADYVILDGEMTKNLPKKIAAATGVDALAHAIECYTSKKANPYSDMFALEALKLILNNIEAACNDPGAMEAKNAMLTASFYAGAAIASSGTTAVHALSYPLGGKYHIPHGIANAMMLVPVMKFNEPMCRARLAEIYDRAAGLGLKTETEQEKSAWVIKRLEQIVKNLEICTSIKEYGIGRDDLQILVKSGISVQRLLVNNMREVTEEDAEKLYLEIM